MRSQPRTLQRLRAVVTTWPFMVSVLLMVINDAWLKAAYPGVLTGKLSDIAGIAIVCLLLLTAQPQRARLVCLAIFAGFAWWKSPLSQPAIDAVNAWLPLSVGRTVDYSDLLAMLVIPLCIPVIANPTAFQVAGPTLRGFLLPPIVVLTTLGLMATSMIPVKQDYQIRRVEGAGLWDRQLVADTVLRVAREHGLDCEKCDDPTSSARYEGKGLYLDYSFVGDRAISFSVDAGRHAKGADRADRLRTDLKLRLASLYSELEYVETLRSR